jgi:signal transduction histidine kinase
MTDRYDMDPTVLLPPNPDGTGFGLNIVQQIVTGHNWEIQVTESISGGARFGITGVKTVD